MSLQLRSITKTFGPIVANDSLSLTIESGEIHGLLGENGAGKSTLAKVLSGFVSPDSGTVELDDEQLKLSSPSAAVSSGIGILHQEPLVFLDFSAVDNMLVGSPRDGNHTKDLAEEHLLKICEQFNFSIDPLIPVQKLSVGERQQLEIARLLWLGARVLILDEPTTAISGSQRENLFQTIRSLAEAGMSVIFVSHKLEEIQEICSRVTVLRQGRIMGTKHLPCPTNDLIDLMFDRELEPQGRKSSDSLGSTCLEIRGQKVTTHFESGKVDMTFRTGEIVGLAGLEGAGQRDLLRSIAGLDDTVTEGVFFRSRDIGGDSYIHRMQYGFHYLPADRGREGLVDGLTITEHVALASPQRSIATDWKLSREESKKIIDKFSIKGTPESVPASLSGGNQQRLLLGLIPDNPTVLLMEHPTRGLDIESAAWVWKYLMSLTEEGTTILFSSSDFDELMTYCDRIFVFFEGAIIQELASVEATTERLGSLLGGVK